MLNSNVLTLTQTQILSIKELLNGEEVELSQTPSIAASFKKAEKADKQDATQGE